MLIAGAFIGLIIFLSKRGNKPIEYEKQNHKEVLEDKEKKKLQ
jgi:hypothetical protein